VSMFGRFLEKTKALSDENNFFYGMTVKGFQMASLNGTWKI
jgi:hypothetical protein